MLELIIGPMFSGKTTHLLESVHKYNHLYNIKCVIVNHSLDDRDTHFSTHSKLQKTCDGDIKLIKKHNLNYEDFKDFDLIGIDEAQFFDKDLITFVRDCLEGGKKVLVSGLNGDKNQNTFGYLHYLIPMCDTIAFKYAKCNVCVGLGDNVDAPFTKCISGCSDKVEVGGSDKYIAVCRKHL